MSVTQHIGEKAAPQSAGLVRRLGSGALARYVRLAFDSSRLVAEPADFHARLRLAHPAIIAFWHGQFMLIAPLRPEDVPISIMVARHGDAEALAGMLRRFGVGLIRGAGAGERGRDRGGTQALREALAALSAGISVGLTADVPPGPARKAGRGIVTMARLSGRPILPIAIASSRYLSLDTWSRMTINLPGSQMGLVVAEPIHVPRALDEAGQEAIRLQVEEALNAATRRAYELAGADMRRATPRSLVAADPSRPPTAPGLALGAYRAGTSLLRPLAPTILERRARRGKEDRARIGERLGRASLERPQGRLVWLHAASVGETNAILPLLRQIKQHRPDLELLLTTGTVTSAELSASRLGGLALHQYLPLDSPRFIDRFLDHWRPDLAVLVESEIWPNLVLQTAARGVPMALVNARMSRRSFERWRRRPGVAEPLFGRFALVLAQNSRLADRFRQLGARAALGVGNLKLDAPPPPVDEAALASLRAAGAGRRVLLAASTHEGEEEVVAAAHKALSRDLPDLLTVVAPRHPERGARVADRVGAAGLRALKRSEGALPAASCDVYVADTIGELGTLYSFAPVAFIGGSLAPKGGQNPIEAVKLRSAVITGPHWHNFKDTYGALLRRHAVCEVRSAEELAAAVRTLHSDSARLSEMLARASAVVASMTGALERTIEALEPLLPAPDARHAA